MSNIYIEYDKEYRLKCVCYALERKHPVPEIDLSETGNGHYLLYYVLSGMVYLDDVPVSKNHGFLIRPGETPRILSDTNNPWTYFMISFEGEDAESMLQDCGFDLSARIFKYNFHQKLVSVFNVMPPASSSTASSVFGAGILNLILSFHKTTDKSGVNSISKTHVYNAIEYMQMNYQNNITISDIAQYLHVDAGYLYNLFIKYLGISPKEYLNRLRYEISCNMLNTTSLSLSEISESIGFSDPFAASKFFKKRSSLSPTEYRNKSEKNKKDVDI